MVQVSLQKGYTLVELLIAMVILLSLMFTANYSYSLYSQYWAGRLGSFDQTVFYYQGLLQVKETLESSIPYIVRSGQQDHTFYFLGRDEGFTLVTVAPIFAPTRNDAAVVRIFREKTAAGYQLVYEEAPLNQRLLLDLDQQLDFKYRTVLMRTDQPIEFSYYGWKLRDHKMDRYVYGSETASWQSAYDAAITRIQPERIRLIVGGQVLEFDLPVGQAKLLNFYFADAL